MDEEKKIKNAALYWINENKEQLPKWKKEAFIEWLESNINHKKEYKKIQKTKDIPKLKD